MAHIYTNIPIKEHTGELNLRMLNFDRVQSIKKKKIMN